jgi:hypothetical protein
MTAISLSTVGSWRVAEEAMKLEICLGELLIPQGDICSYYII